MRVLVNKISDKEKEEAIISIAELTPNIKQAIELLENTQTTLIGIKDGQSYVIEMPKIYYIESIDNKTFIYVKND